MRDVKASLIAVVLLTAVFGFAFPAVMTGFAQVAFEHKANGSLITRNGKVVGSELAAQEFKSARYFHERPSATVARLQRRRDHLREPRADQPGSGEERPERGPCDPSSSSGRTTPAS